MFRKGLHSGGRVCVLWRVTGATHFRLFLVCFFFQILLPSCLLRANLTNVTETWCSLSISHSLSLWRNVKTHRWFIKSRGIYSSLWGNPSPRLPKLICISVWTSKKCHANNCVAMKNISEIKKLTENSFNHSVVRVETIDHKRRRKPQENLVQPR